MLNLHPWSWDPFIVSKCWETSAVELKRRRWNKMVELQNPVCQGINLWLLPTRKELSLWADWSVICLLRGSPHPHLCKRLLNKKENEQKNSSLWSTEIPECVKSWAVGQNFRGSEAGRWRCRSGRAALIWLPAAGPPGALSPASNLEWEEKVSVLQGEIIFLNFIECWCAFVVFCDKLLEYMKTFLTSAVPKSLILVEGFL